MATGKSPLTYQWKQGTAAIPGATSSTLSVPQTIYPYNNAATYGVIVSDASGAQVASRTATLTIVSRPPAIIEATGHLRRYSSFRLSCLTFSPKGFVQNFNCCQCAFPD